MTQGILQTDVYTDFSGLNALRSRARADGDSEETLRKVAGQFEALFVQMMLKSMRDASLGDSMLDNEHTKTYQAMFDKQISIEMSQGAGIGLAEIMVQQLRRQQGADSSGDNKQDVDAGAEPVAPMAVPSRQTFNRLSVAPSTPLALEEVMGTGPEEDLARDWAPGSPTEFVRELWPHARRAADELGARPEMLVAQAALETGWGQHMIRGADGANSFNLFGIKADAGWQGARVTTETVEFRDGLMRRERARFRAYASPQESFSDYVDFLKRNPRYQDALRQAGDAPAFAQALSAAGYATDPDYSTKINRIMNSELLRNTVSDISVAAREPLGG